LEKKGEYNGTVHRLFSDFKKPYNSIKKEIKYSIVILFGILKKTGSTSEDVSERPHKQSTDG